MKRKHGVIGFIWKIFLLFLTSAIIVMLLPANHIFRPASFFTFQNFNMVHIQIIGQFILIFIALLSFLAFLRYVIANIYEDTKKIVLILCVIILMVVLTRWITFMDKNYIYVVPLCLTPVLIRTFFDFRSALYAFIINLLIIGFSVSNSFEFIFMQLMAGVMAIIGMEHLEKRYDFIKMSGVVFFSYTIVYVALEIIHTGSWTNMNGEMFIYFAINAVLLLFAFPLIYVFERIFGFVSDISLLEYSNTNSKILRELSQKAPGTFNHCVQVANIAEELIHRIGGNALLIRAGALHHDIGKTRNPLFFVENQTTGFNPHDELSSEESAQIIISHVSDGVKLAYKYKLPESIIDFIRSHHGTSRTKYFYNKQKIEHPEMPVDEYLFTYKGPKPFSKETAVLMMVDSVEAASRSLKEYSEQTVSALVENIIDEQIKTEQFSNADITYKDISIIKETLKHKLQAIYHTRIQYPVIK